MSAICTATVYRGTWSQGSARGKSAKHEHEGVMYCKLHHPPTAQAKNKARNEKWNAEWNAKEDARSKAAAEAAEQKRRADCFPDLLEALQLAHDYLAGNGWDNDERLLPIRAAIAKALGEQP